MTNLYFEELEIGSRSTAGHYLLAKDEIIRFAMQYDPIPRHIDEEAAARSVFGGLTASGSDTFAVYILLFLHYIRCAASGRERATSYLKDGLPPLADVHCSSRVACQ